ncbi:MAG: TetR/AcrR family transcriptional regulator [Terracidiphilus sp.]
MVITALDSDMNVGQIRLAATSDQTQPPGGLAHTPGTGRRQRRAAETRVRLFRCALQLFAERGFSSVTVEEITEAADVGKGTFFNYFETKDHVLCVMAEIQLGKVKEAIANAGQGKQTIRTVLHRLVLRLSEEPGRSPSLARAFLSSFLASESVRIIIARHMQEGRGMIAEVIAAGQERGEIQPRLKKETVAIQLLQTCMGTVLFWSLDGASELKSRIEDSFQHFWRAVCIPAQKQES